ncbi:MAG TPA: hypothetical protein VHS58_16925 [Acetobacteraceae bacterium]|jgi:hypothetical protein|nr:hypothetical protein [Acetobacteraceae bacterium]
MAGIGRSATITARATVQSVDPATRGITLVGPAGNQISLVAGPQVVNFDKIKAGDTVIVRYQESVAYVLSPPNTKLPESSLTGAAVGAPKGGTPAGAVARRLVVTGLVVGINPSDHSLQLVDPSGGALRTIHVVSAEGLRNFDMIKVGDTITAVASQAIAAAVEPTK